jgi:hypothetical protein
MISWSETVVVVVVVVVGGGVGKVVSIKEFCEEKCSETVGMFLEPSIGSVLERTLSWILVVVGQ